MTSSTITRFFGVIVLTLLMATVAIPEVGFAETTKNRKTLTFGGSLRTYGIASFYPETFSLFDEKEHFARALLRLTAEAHLAEWLSFNCHLVQNLDYYDSYEQSLFVRRLDKRRFQALKTPWDWLNQENFRAGFWFDRLNVKLSLSWADFTLGRQAITFGKTYFWNPLDVFLPFLPWEFDRDYKPGVDALRIDIPLGNFSGMNLIGILGRELVLTETLLTVQSKEDLSWYGSALLARFYTLLAGWDLALQGGKIYGGYQFAGGVSGDLGIIDVRLETAYFIAQERPPLPSPFGDKLLENHYLAVFGLGWTFDNSLIIEFEYMYNGSANTRFLEASFLRWIHGSAFHMSESLLGTMMSYDILPILNARLVWILSVSDRSFLLQPHFSLSLSDEMDLVCGATVCSGGAPHLIEGDFPHLRTEFGTYPDILYILFKLYF